MLNQLKSDCVHQFLTDLESSKYNLILVALTWIKKEIYLRVDEFQVSKLQLFYNTFQLGYNVIIFLKVVQLVLLFIQISFNI